MKHAYFKLRAQDPPTILNKALSLVFPPRFLDNLMNEQLIDVYTANKWLLEYRKYLVLAYLSDTSISPSEQVDQVWHLHMTYTQHYRATCQTLVEREFKHTPSLGGSAEGKKYENVYDETLSFYKEIFLVDPPSDVWETPQQRFEMKNFEYRNINLYRLAFLFSMKVANPNFLQMTPPVTHKPAPASMMELSKQQKKMILRRNKRNKFKGSNQNYGWRNNYGHSNVVYYDGYHHSHSSDSSHDGHHHHHDKHDHHRCHNNEYDYYGPDYMVGGGLIILGNPFDSNYNGDRLHEGFYDDMDLECIGDANIDDIADAAEADVDLMADNNLAEYGAQEMGIDDFNHDLGIEQDMVALQEEGNMDFNDDAMAADDGFGAGDLGGNYVDGGNDGGGCGGGDGGG